jgi:hypothetical protein
MIDTDLREANDFDSIQEGQSILFAGREVRTFVWTFFRFSSETPDGHAALLEAVEKLVEPRL